MQHRLWLIVLVSFLFGSTLQAETIRVAAAADLRYVMPDLVASFEKQFDDIKVAVTYAASGSLTTQIRHGAPYDLFFSANPLYINHLIEQGLTASEPVDYAQGYLALFAANHSKLSVDAELKGLKIALASGQLHKLAIANPQHAPYGQAAMQLMQDCGIEAASISPYLLLAENASQVTQFSLSSEVDAGFIPYTHAIQPNIAAKGRSVKLAITLQQQMVLIKNHHHGTADFAEFITTEQGKRLFKQHGFAVPEDV